MRRNLHRLRKNYGSDLVLSEWIYSKFPIHSNCATCGKPIQVDRNEWIRAGRPCDWVCEECVNKDEVEYTDEYIAELICILKYMPACKFAIVMGMLSNEIRGISNSNDYQEMYQ